MGHSKSSNSNIILPQETRKFSDKQAKIIPKTTRENKTNKTYSTRNHVTIREKINEIETKKIANFSEAKSWSFETINKIDKPLAKFIRKTMEKTQINKIRS